MSRYTLFQGRYGAGCGSDECPKDGDDTTRVCLARGTVPCDVLFVGEAPGESENVLGKPFCGPAGHLLDYVINRSVPGKTLRCAGCNLDVTRLVGVGQYGGCPKCRSYSIHATPGVSYCLTNLVCCIPREYESGGKASEPLPEQIRQCSQRLIDFVGVCYPKVIVTVGRLARDWLDPKCHPRHRVDLPKACEVCGLPQYHCRGGWTCPNGHGGAGGVDIPRVEIIHPAAILRMNVAQRGLAVQRCVVAATGAVREYVLTAGG